MIKEKAARKKRASQINTVKTPEPEGEVNAVAKRKEAGSKTGTVCANHLRFPGKCYRCFDPDNCLLKDIRRPTPPRVPAGGRETPGPAASSAGCRRPTQI